MPQSRHPILLLLLAVVHAGCQQPEPPHLAPSDKVQQLGADAEDDEDRQFWQELRDQIAKLLVDKSGTLEEPQLLSNPQLAKQHLRAGREVYAERCQACHGLAGDGNGEVAQYFTPKPRDYRKGIFKFTSTPYGSKPLRSDLIRTVQRGVTGTSMPSFDQLPDAKIEAVVDYVLVLTERGELEQQLVQLAEDEEELDPDYVQEIVDTIASNWNKSELPVAPKTLMPPMTAESIAQGRQLFLSKGCSKCHGADGRGGLAGGIDVGTDTWGHRDPAADLTSGMFRGGNRPIDIYRRIYNGINGTPMPSFATEFRDNPEAIWRLVHFVLDVGQRRRRGQALPPPPADPHPVGAETADSLQTAIGSLACDEVTSDE